MAMKNQVVDLRIARMDSFLDHWSYFYHTWKIVGFQAHRGGFVSLNAGDNKDEKEYYGKARNNAIYKIEREGWRDIYLYIAPEKLLIETEDLDKLNEFLVSLNLPKFVIEHKPNVLIEKEVLRLYRTSPLSVKHLPFDKKDAQYVLAWAIIYTKSLAGIYRELAMDIYCYVPYFAK